MEGSPPPKGVWKRRCCILLEVLLVLLGIGLVVQIFFVPDAVDDIFTQGLEDTFVITSETQKENNSIWTHWVSNDHDDSPNQYFNYYLYNITNPYEVLQGAYPNLTELGPFVFNRISYKRQIQFSDDDDIVSYRYVYDFQYLEDLSTPNYTLEDNIIVFNPAVLTMINNVNIYFPGIANVFDDFLESLEGERAFYFKSVYDVLWNTSDYEVEDQFGTDTFFSCLSFAANNVEEYTGHSDHKDMRKLRKYYNESAMSFWSCSNDTEDYNQTHEDKDVYYEDTCICDDLEGCFYYEAIGGSRESVQFPYDWVKKDSELVLWETEKYRKAYYYYEKTVHKHGVKMYRFKVSNETFYNATQYPDNAHYNQFGPEGVVNLTTRKVHLSIMQQSVALISKGRFLGADYYINTVSAQMGISTDPDPVEDDQWFDVEPLSGAVFHRHLAYQVNLGVAPLRQLFNDTTGELLHSSNFSNLTNMYVPYYLVQVDAEATAAQYNEFASKVNLVDTIIDVSIYGGAAGALVCFIVAICLIRRRRKRERSLPQAHGYKQVMRPQNALATDGLTTTPSMGQANALPTSTPERGGGYGSTSDLRALENNGGGGNTRGQGRYERV